MEKGADVHKGKVGEETPLFWAVKKGRLDIVEFLLKKGADVHKGKVIPKGEVTPLCLAVRNEHLDIVEFLLTKVSTNQIFDEIRRGNKTEAMILLKKHGLNKKNENDDNALTVAIHNGQYDIAKELLKIDGLDINANGLDINANGVFGTALMVINKRMSENASDKESLKEIAKILVEKGADLTIEKGGKAIHEDLKSIIKPLQDPSGIAHSISSLFSKGNPTGR